MKKSLISILGVLAVMLFMNSCEEVDPTGTIVFDNKDDCTYECFFDGKSLGTVSNLTTASFEVDAICAKVKAENDDYGVGEIDEACVPDGGTYTATIDLAEPTGTLYIDNWESCGYYCYFDEELLGYVTGFGTKSFTVEVGCGTVRVEASSGSCSSGYKDDVCIEKGETYTLKIDFKKKNAGSDFFVKL